LVSLRSEVEMTQIITDVIYIAHWQHSTDPGTVHNREDTQTRLSDLQELRKWGHILHFCHLFRLVCDDWQDHTLRVVCEVAMPLIHVSSFYIYSFE
jgi:hypothetical protein